MLKLEKRIQELIFGRRGFNAVYRIGTGGCVTRVRENRRK